MLTIENQNSWQPLWPYNKAWHWTAFTIVLQLLKGYNEVWNSDQLKSTGCNGDWIFKHGGRCLLLLLKCVFPEQKRNNDQSCRMLNGGNTDISAGSVTFCNFDNDRFELEFSLLTCNLSPLICDSATLTIIIDMQLFLIKSINPSAMLTNIGLKSINPS